MNLIVLFAWPRLIEIHPSLIQHLHEPIHALANAFAVNNRTGNDAPVPVPQLAQLERF